MTTQHLQLLPLSSHAQPSSSSQPSLFSNSLLSTTGNANMHSTTTTLNSLSLHHHNCILPLKQRLRVSVSVNADNTAGSFFDDRDTTTALEDDEEDEEEEEEIDPTPDDLEYISEIKRVLGLLKRNRDMLFGEVKLTIMIEDPREVERKRLLGIDDSDGPTRDDMVAALEDVNEGKVPRNRLALRMLAEEMTSWPNLEVEPIKKTKTKSLYAKATDTGIDPLVAAKRLNVDWDKAAEIEEAEVSDDNEVPPLLGYGALYLVSAFPVIIGVSVVLILFYNSLQ